MKRKTMEPATIWKLLKGEKTTIGASGASGIIADCREAYALYSLSYPGASMVALGCCPRRKMAMALQSAPAPKLP